MKLVVQRVTRATVEVDGLVESRIGLGLVIFVGVRRGDSIAKAQRLAKLAVKLQLYQDLSDPEKEFTSTVAENGHEILVVHQPSLCARFAKPAPSDVAAMDDPAAQRAFDAFVKALQVEYQEEMVVSAPLSPLALVELTSDGPNMYTFDTDDVSPATAAATPAGRAVLAGPLEPNVTSVTGALRRLRGLKGSKATLEGCRIFRVFSMKVFRDALSDIDQNALDEFVEALDAGANAFSRTQQLQIMEWTGLSITAPEDDGLDYAGDDGEADVQTAEAETELEDQLAALHGDVEKPKVASAGRVKKEVPENVPAVAMRKPDWRGRAAPNTPSTSKFSQAWAQKSAKGAAGKGGPVWQQHSYSKGATEGKGTFAKGRRSYGIASLDEANNLHGGEGGGYDHGQLGRFSDRNIAFTKAEPEDEGPPEKRSRTDNGGLLRPKGTPTVAPACPATMDELDEL